MTSTFCEESRYFRPENGARIDAVRTTIEQDYADTALWPVLLTSLLEAADRVDSTTGLQMAYLKQWAPRAHQPLDLRVPALIPGAGRAVRGDARELAGSPVLGHVDLAYLDPPYNQHRYDANYHVWETIVAWDAPAHYGVACKREDLRDPAGRSAFNGRRTMPEALSRVVTAVDAEVVVLSYNNESWLSFDQLHDLFAGRGHVEVLAFDSARYVGARIGIHDPAGRKVGSVSHLRNTEYVLVAGERDRVRSMVGGGDRCRAGHGCRPSRAGGRRPGSGFRVGLTGHGRPCQRGPARPTSPPRGGGRHELAPRPRSAPQGEKTWEHWTDGWRSSPGPGAASGGSTPCSSPPRAPRSWSTTWAGRVDGSGDDRSAAQQVVDEITAVGGEAVANGDDVSDWDGGKRLVDTAIEAFGDLHVLVNNAGILRDRVLVNMSEDDWDSVIHVHLKGHFVPTRHAAAYWREQTKAGKEVKASVVNTSSTSGLLGNPVSPTTGRPRPGSPPSPPSPPTSWSATACGSTPSLPPPAPG